MFPELSAFATVEDLVSHLRTSDARYPATLPAQFLAKNPPPMYITLYYIVTRLPDSLHAVDVLGAEDVGAASASAKCHSSKGKGGRGGGGGSGGGGGGSSGGGGGSGGGGSGRRSGGFGGGGGGSGGSGGSGSGGRGGGRTGAQRGGSGGGQRQRQQCRSKSLTPQQLQLLRTGVVIFDLDFDAILAAMYALSASAEGDCYLCVPPDPGIEAAALGASESSLPGSAPAEALHTFTLDSSASRCFFRDSTTLTPLPVRLHLPSFSTNLVSTAALQDVMVTTTTPGGSSLYTLATEPPQVAASAQVSASGQVAPPCSCRLLSHHTLLWHHRLGHPSLPRLRGVHSRLLASGLLRSQPPLPPSPAPPCLPCVEGQQRAAPHSSFPLTTAPLQTLHMDVWGPARVSGQGRGRYFLLDLPVLFLHSDRGGEFYSDLLQDFCRGEGILQSITLPDSPQKNGIAERRIGLDMEVARTSMIHAVAPHFLWPFAVRYAAHQLNLWPRVFLPETSPTNAECGDAEPQGAALSGGLAGALPILSPRPETLSPQQLRKWLVRRTRLRSGATGAEGTGDAGAGGTGVTAGATGTRGTAGAGPGGARTRGTGAAGSGGVGGAGAGDPTEPGAAGAGGARAGGARAVGAGARGTGTRGAGAGGAGVVDPGAGGTVRARPYFVPLLQQILGVPSFTGLPPPLLCPPHDQSQPPLQLASPLPTPSPYTEQSGGLIERREPASCPASPIRTGRRVPRLRPPPVPGTHAMALRPSSSYHARAASPTVSRLLTTVVTDPSFESTAASALVAELLDFAAACRLDYATSHVTESESASPPSVGGECALGTDVLEDRQEDFECLSATVPRFASMLLVSNLYTIVCLGCSVLRPCPAPAPPSRAAPLLRASPPYRTAPPGAEPRRPAEPSRPTEPHRPAEPRRPSEPHCPTCAAPVATAASTATAATAATAAAATMASPNVLTFDAEGRAVDFDVWVDDLQLFLQCDSKDDHTHLPSAERAQFGQYKTAKSLYDAVVARYSSPTTAGLSRLMLPYLFPDLAALATVADLITHLRTSDARYRAALPTQFCAKNPPPPCASRNDPCAPFFEGCSPVPLLPSVASAAAVDLDGTEEVGAASAHSGRCRNNKGKGSKGGGGDGGGGGGGGGGGRGGGGGGGGGGGSGGFGGGGGGSGGSNGGGGGSSSGGGGGSGGGAGRGGAAQRGGFGGGSCKGYGLHDVFIASWEKRVRVPLRRVEAAAAVVEVAAAVVLVEVEPRSVEALVVASASSSRVPVRLCKEGTALLVQYVWHGERAWRTGSSL
ncbi:unnamed protein product [Closterium sp. NIES-54]